MLHADVRAEVSADRYGKRRVGQGDVHGLVDEPLADHLPALLHGDAGGAAGLAGRQEFQVFPHGDVAPEDPGRDQRDRAAVEIRQIPDEPSLPEFLVPDEPTEIGHLADGLDALFGGLAGHEKLPGRAVRQQRFLELAAADRLEEFLQVAGKPAPLIVADLGEPGVLFAEPPVGAAEEDPAAHHAHAGPVAEDVVRVVRLVAADHRGAARHELGEGVACTPEDPQLRRSKPRVLLRHRHAPGADVAGYVDLPLRHGVADAVGRLAVDDDPGARVEPTHVVRCGPHDLDKGVGKPHGAHALPGRTGDPDRDGLVAGLPEPAADAVLPEGLHLDEAMPVRHGLLHTLLEDAGIHALPAFDSLDDRRCPGGLRFLLLRGFSDCHVTVPSRRHI